MRKAVCVLSGGLDSTVSLALARKQRVNVKQCLFFDYGQQSAKREENAARRIARFYNVPFNKIKLDWLKEICKTSLVNTGKKIPSVAVNDLDKKKVTTKSAKAAWVPNRNGVFINVAAAVAESIGADLIITGFNAEEAQTFPDNTKEYADVVTKSLSLSTLVRAKVKSFTQNLTKKDIVRIGRKLGAPLHLTWSCYRGNAKPCMMCESCQRAKRAFNHE